MVRKHCDTNRWTQERLVQHPRETSVLDHIISISHMPDNINNITVINPYTLKLFSDHKCALFDLQISLKLKRPVYDYRHTNLEEINRNLMNIDFKFSERS